MKADKNDRSARQFYGWIVVHLVFIILLSFFMLEQQMNVWADAFLAQSPTTSLIAIIVIAALTFDILLPIPASLVSIATVVLIGGSIGWLVLFAGLMCSSMFGYWVGHVSDQKLLTKLISPQNYARTKLMQTRWGLASIVLMRPVPVMAEVTVIMAGIDRVNFKAYLFVSLIANAGVSSLYILFTN